ncbi:MAG: hypothetical protein D6830_04490 [Ignavibacteria bacterium]|nr:MAG: hypothetical protein D6830_04490 [Ignavibacteria bacterium]
MNKNFKNWDIKKGDYQRESENPMIYHESYKIKKRLGKMSKILLSVFGVFIVIIIIVAAVLL